MINKNLFSVYSADFRSKLFVYKFQVKMPWGFSHIRTKQLHFKQNKTTKKFLYFSKYQSFIICNSSKPRHSPSHSTEHTAHGIMLKITVCFDLHYCHANFSFRSMFLSSSTFFQKQPINQYSLVIIIIYQTIHSCTGSFFCVVCYRYIWHMHNCHRWIERVIWIAIHSNQNLCTKDNLNNIQH